MGTKIKISAIIIFSLFAVSFLAQKGAMQTKQAETAGQRFKNIKVLNDMPADQMGKVMNLMSAGLGVNCNFCHVENDFAKDGKEEKEAARQMIKMTLDLNKNNFGGRTEITCNTCHQGRAHPQSAVNLNPIAAAPERPKQPDVKPSVERILEKYTEAIGGRENLTKIVSRRITANRVEPNGTVEPEDIWQKGNKLLIATKYPQVLVTEIFDGTNVWKQANNADIPLKSDEIEQTRRNAQFFSLTDLKIVYPKMEFRTVDKIDGRDAYLVIATTADNSRERLYFDVQNGFLIRRTASASTILGAFQHQVDYSDYKDFGGVKLPTTIRYAVPNISWTRKILEVKNNAAIDDGVFRVK